MNIIIVMLKTNYQIRFLVIFITFLLLENRINTKKKKKTLPHLFPFSYIFMTLSHLLFLEFNRNWLCKK
jgi:hypothetical protein